MTTIDPAVRDRIHDCLHRYATGIDRRDWALLRSAFTDDCVAEYGPIGSRTGGDALAEWMAEMHTPCGHTMHRLTNIVVSGEGGVISSRTYVDALVLQADNVKGVRCEGFYDDEWTPSADGDLRIARRTFTMVRLEHLE